MYDFQFEIVPLESVEFRNEGSKSFRICLVDLVFLTDEKDSIESTSCDFVARRYNYTLVIPSIPMNLICFTELFRFDVTNCSI